MSMTSGPTPGTNAPTTPAVVQAAANTITATAAVPVGAPPLSHPLIAAILALMPPVGSHWDDDDRISWHHLWDDAIDILYHQPDNPIIIAPAPPPAPSDGASTDGSATPSNGNGSTTPVPAVS